MAARWASRFLHLICFAVIAAGIREEASEVAVQFGFIAETLTHVDECLALKRTDSECFYRNLCNRSLSFTMESMKLPLPQYGHGHYNSPYPCDHYPVEAFQRYHAHELDTWQKQKTCWKTDFATVLGKRRCFAENSCDFKLQVACRDKVITPEAMYSGKVDNFWCTCEGVPPKPVQSFPKKWTVKNKAQEHCFGVKKQDDKCLARNYCDESLEVEGNFQLFKAKWRGWFKDPSTCDRFNQKAFDVFFNDEQKQWKADMLKFQTQQKCFHSIKTVNGGCVVSNTCADESLTVQCKNCERTVTLKARNDYFANTCFCDCTRPQPPEPSRSK